MKAVSLCSVVLFTAKLCCLKFAFVHLTETKTNKFRYPCCCLFAVFKITKETSRV